MKRRIHTTTSDMNTDEIKVHFWTETSQDYKNEIDRGFLEFF
jgi:hypothetical protein